MQVDFNVLAILATIIIGVVGSIAGIVIPLHIHLASSVKEEVRAIREEMKDFHGRLERQDAEFKAFMRGEEERRTKILLERR